MTERNCLSFWFPKLRDAGLPVPTTKIIKLADADAEDLMRVVMQNEGAPKPNGDGFDRLVAGLTAAARATGFPCFLRSGVFSGKHEWKYCCYLAEPANVGKQLRHIVYLGELFNMLGMPHDVWCVREFLKPAPGDVAFESEAFDGMPVRREFRCFVRGPEVVCLHPYWPKGALDSDMTPEREAALAAINEPGEHEGAIRALASKAGAALGGNWSIDVLSTDRGWFITDCAVAAQSYHWEGCANKAMLAEGGEG